MEEYYRLVIDTLKQSLSDILASGDIDREMVSQNIRTLEFEIDKRIVGRQDHSELNALRSDLLWLKLDLCDE